MLFLHLISHETTISPFYNFTILPYQTIGIAELRAQLAEQERTIRMLVQQKNHNEIEMGERSGLIQDKAKSATGS